MYIHKRYTMKDIYEAELLCEHCRKATHKSLVHKEGFPIRSWHCLHCNQQWFHPGDLENFKAYQHLRERSFHVKMREVGNSWIISIPKEIVHFQELQDAEKIVQIHIDEPGRVIISFSRVRKIY
ncbi:hypothetical protein HZA98_04985 [Candidatus Woesearchaeota archaeon]|nr:hypothetical protein [Candidatus Woesearchaeota archaeon]